MKRIFTFVFTLISVSAFLKAQSPIISQYYEGASNDKWIEIVNPYSTSIDLTGFYLALFANAAADNPAISSPGATIALSGNLSPNGTLLFKNISAVNPTYASGTSSGVCNFNGDDLVIVTTSNSGTNCWANRTDVVGDGTSWGTDISFYRNANINAPNLTYTPSEWTSVSYVNVNNAVSTSTEYLGTHIITTLPVQLFEYKIYKYFLFTKITFSTSSETNSSHFLIEWSRDANEWNEIGTVKASGTTHDVKEYTFIHENPKAGINYYRLTQVDFDGRKETFPVKSVYFGSNQRNFDIIPNLAFNNVKIEFEKPVENGRLHIYNIDGQLMQSYVLASGIDVLRIDVSELPAGQYIAKYIDGEDTINRKFIKQ